MKKATLSELLEALHESLETSTADEIRRACELIIEVQDMDNGMRDCIIASYENGPISDGYIPSPKARDCLVQNNYMVKVVRNGEDGYNACTYKGAWAYRLIQAGA